MKAIQLKGRYEYQNNPKRYELLLFTDGSVDTRSRIGYGAYLAVTDRGLSAETLKKHITVRRFEPTSSTRLELQTLIWALNDIQATERRIIIYTDSQNITGLPARRNRLEQNDYRSKSKKRLNHYELYQAFYRITDRLDCKVVKVRGHQASNQKDEIDRLFTLVDRASRQALRSDRR